MYNPSKSSTDTNGEWIELINLGSSDIDLNGWKINDNNSSHAISTSLIITANGGLLVLCRNGDSNLNGGVSCAYVYSSLQLANTSDEVVIKDASDSEHDKVSYDNSSFPHQEGSSIELTSPSLDNSIGGNWHISTSTFGLGDKGTPGLANSNSPTSSPTPTPTSTPTPTALSINTPTPTSTKSPTPKPTQTPQPTISETETPETLVLGTENTFDEKEASESAKEKKSFPFLPFLFIVAGLACIGIALFLVFKKGRAYNEKSEENN